MNSNIISSIIQGVGTIGGSLLNKPQDSETRMQRKQRYLVDDLLKSLDGGGKFGDIFSTDEETFNKSFREPAMSRFRNQTAPQIQQESIFSGQQRGTGLDDQLLRAGVDMDSILNQAMFDYQQKGLDRKSNAINGILGMGAGASNPMSTLQALGQGASAYLGSENFANLTNDLFNPKTNLANNQNVIPQRSGYTAKAQPLPTFNPSLSQRSY